MSLINNMLQDLDSRRALGGDADTAGVRAPAAKPKRREWFWYTLAALMLLSVSWVGWMAFQLMPRPLTLSPLTLSPSKESRVPEARVPPKPVAQVPAPALQPAASEPAPPVPPSPPAQSPPSPPAQSSPSPPAQPVDTLRLAREIETPISEAPKPQPQAVRPAKPAMPTQAPGTASAKGTVDKFDRNPYTPQSAPNYFARAVALLNQGRLAEAEQQLAAALQAEPSHAPARQAYVALLLEQRRGEAARRLLQEGLALAPAHPEFALALARIHTERREYAAALKVMDEAGDVAAETEFQALRGAVLQRLGRHAEAVDAYQNALRAAPQPATSWLGLAISLEALGRRPEASQAYRRALSAGPLASEAREYAEVRARATQ